MECRFLEEHHEAFAGTSNVRDLATGVSFKWDQSDRSTWWAWDGKAEAVGGQEVGRETLSATFLG